MKISSIVGKDKLTLSFEVFPPKTDSDFEKVKETFDLKQGANTKKVKATDITKLQKLLEV